MAVKEMRIGTIGNGSIVEGFANAVEQAEHASIEAVYLRPHNVGKGFDEKLKVKKVYTQVDELLADDAINFVYIALPNSLHFPYAKKALMAGKHVILEKPFTSNVAETKALIALAQEKSLFLFEAISVIHMPNFHTLKHEIGSLGTLSLVQANYSQYSSKYPKLLEGETPNVFNPDFSGGCLMDINYYNVYGVVALFGKPKHVHYYAKKHVNGVDLSGVVVLDYGDFTAVCAGAKDSVSLNYFQVQGDRGYALVPNGINGVSSVEFVRGSEKEVVNMQTINNRLYYEVEAFVKAYQNDDFTQANQWLALTLEVMETIESCLKEIGLNYTSPNDI